MAPRATKTKKATEIKLADNEVPKKGKGKAKNIEADQENLEVLDEKVAPVTEKKKRGRKAANENKEQSNGNIEEPALPAKKGRKKKVEEPAPVENESTEEVDSIDDKDSLEDETQKSDQSESNETNEVAITNGKGRKKPAKKLPESKETAKKIAKQDNEDVTEETIAPKVAKGRGRKPQPKADSEEKETPEQVDEVKPEPATKGRKKAVAKSAKDKQPKDEPTVEQEEQKVEVPKKGRGRKNPTKKTVPKDKSAESDEQPDTEETEQDEEPASKKQKVDEGKGEPKDDELAEEAPEAKPAKGRRGRKPAEPATENQEPQDTGEATNKRRRKPNEEKAQEDTKKKAPSKNKNSTEYESIDFSNSSKNAQSKEWNFKICSWNVDGIRAWMGKGGLDYLKYEKPDILCLQEVKCAREKLPEEIANVPGYHAYWLCSEQDGYAGVGIYTTKLAMNVQYGLGNEELDSDGRIITAEYEQFYLICTYVPNAGRKLVTLPKRLQWNDAFRNYVKELDKKKPVIICGDMNVAHNEIDLANPKTNRKNAGFTEEERSGMTDLLGDGFVDIYRHLNPDKTSAYTFWTYMMNSRAKNVGWRLDYFLTSARLLPAVCDSTIRDQVYGSDHCPITLFLHLTSADKPKAEN